MRQERMRMALVVELLGVPRIVRAGAVAAGPRGRKTWALLAYLLLADRPPTRERLAELLFPDAEDPLGALRWSLSELRRALGPGCEVGGDPVTLVLPSATAVDIDLVRRGRWHEAVDVPGLGRPLLDGTGVSGSAAFEIWLANERRRLDGAAEAVLHEAALASQAAGATADALAFAGRLVELRPLEEAHHVLLVQCLRSAGDTERAAAHVSRCTDLFVRELGIRPSGALAEAARTPEATGAATPPTRSLLAMLEAGEAAVGAGAVSQGTATLWAAAAECRRRGDRRVLARVLVALGHALVHGGRGGDEEGAAVLHEAAACATESGDGLVAAAAYRELAFADVQRGRYDRSAEWLATAATLAAGDDLELAWIEAQAGAAQTDRGHYADARRSLVSALARSERHGHDEAAVFARSFLGRLHLLRGEVAEATAHLREAVRAGRTHWMAFAPFPEALLAEAELEAGDVEGAAARFDRAFVMGRQLDDACIESLATRGLGRVAVARRDHDRGYELLVEAPRRSRRLPDSYIWIEAYGLEALSAVAVARNEAAAARWVGELEALASRHGMRELLARAMLHRARLGDPGAFEAASELAAAVANPALDRELAAAAV